MIALTMSPSFVSRALTALSLRRSSSSSRGRRPILSSFEALADCTPKSLVRRRSAWSCPEDPPSANGGGARPPRPALRLCNAARAPLVLEGLPQEASIRIRRLRSTEHAGSFLLRLQELLPLLPKELPLGPARGEYPNTPSGARRRAPREGGSSRSPASWLRAIEISLSGLRGLLRRFLRGAGVLSRHDARGRSSPPHHPSSRPEWPHEVPSSALSC